MLTNHAFQKILTSCAQRAQDGYITATEQLDVLNEALHKAVINIEHVVNAFTESPCDIPEINSALTKQLIDVEHSIQQLSQTTTIDIETLKKNISTFSISLFGRTMVGKSTLMEILTHGDGASIGKGAQRTTRDIRKYPWHSMLITDVPGIGAVDGEQDEDVAWEAAKSADLVLFIVSDDGVQPIEAEWLGRVLGLGKPVICIVNVKQMISETDNSRIATKRINKRFDLERLDAIKKQFLEYDESLGQNWHNIRFAYVHLRSAYLAQKIVDREQAKALHDVSRIDTMLSLLMEQVRLHGEFYREKTFLDAVTVPLINAEEILLNQGSINRSQAYTINRKKVELSSWISNFERNCEKKTQAYIAALRDQIRTEIAEFAEHHFDNKSVNDAWNSRLKQFSIDARCRELYASFNSQCDNEISEIARSISFELSYSPVELTSSSLKAYKIVDMRKFIRWSAIIGGNGILVGTLVAQLLGVTISGPVGWIGLVIGATGGLAEFIKSRETKEREARKKLEAALQKSTDSICESAEKTIRKNTAEIILKKLRALEKEISKVERKVDQLSKTQMQIAWDINDNVLNLNQKFLSAVLRIINQDHLEPNIIEAARVPGSCMTLVLRDKVVLPANIRQQMIQITNEYIGFTFPIESKRIMVSRVIGKTLKRADISYDSRLGVVRIPNCEITPYLQNKIKMAQQLTQVLITV